MGSSSKIVSLFEVLETRTLMSAGLMPLAHSPVKASTKVPAKAAISAPLRNVPVKTVDPKTTDKSITYQSFASDPLFAANGPTLSDVNQGYLGDCYLLSTLSSVAKTDPGLIRKDIVADGSGIYTVTFGSGKGTEVNVNADLPVWSDGQLAYAQFGNQNSIWVAIYEKAYALYANEKAASYNTINGGWMSSAFAALGLKSDTNENATSASNLITTLAADLKAGDFTTFGTQSTLPSDSPLVSGHAYEVDSVKTTASGNPVSVTLRNPWGNGVADDGMITITAQQAYDAFAGVVTAHA